METSTRRLCWELVEYFVIISPPRLISLGFCRVEMKHMSPHNSVLAGVPTLTPENMTVEKFVLIEYKRYMRCPQNPR